jgi:deoxyribodipyrimidine photo-lyase
MLSMVEQALPLRVVSPPGSFTVVVALEGQWRLDDQPCLHEAVALLRSKQGGQLVLLATRPDSQRLRGPHQRKLENDALRALGARTQAMGLPFLCFPMLTTEAALEKLARQFRPDVVLYGEKSRLFAQCPVASEAQFPRVFSEFRRLIQGTPEPPLPEPDWSALVNKLDPWAKNWSRLSAGPPAKPPAHDHSDPRSSFPYPGDEASAMARLHHYVFDTDGLKNYKATRTQLVGSAFSSKFSPFLAIGSLSVRRIWQALDAHRATWGPSEGCDWMRQELLWREFFLWSEKAHGETFYNEAGIQRRLPHAHPDRELFRRWTRAECGHGLIDAQLRELNATGYLSNRGRQWVASHFVNSLRLPWIWGASYFEWMLIDADPALNAGNWAYLAGVGSDPRSFGGQPRRFDLARQAHRYDPDGRHAKQWR